MTQTAPNSNISQFYCDIFCRVIDNFGDVGVTLRLARQLATEHNATVRLIVDDFATYGRIASERTLNLTVCAWQDALLPPQLMPEEALNSGVSSHIISAANSTFSVKLLVIEAFGCALPESYIEALSHQYGAETRGAQQLCWLNLEYLSAEDWVESHHLLPSHHPRLPLTKTFFFPGFTPRTGGLLREHDLMARRDQFLRASASAEAIGRAREVFPSKQQLLTALGVPPPLLSHALIIFLFCYENLALKGLLQSWQASPQPIVCLLPAERTQKAVCTALGLETSDLCVGVPKQLGALTLLVTPLLPQPDFDQLLWACDLNFVRGEDTIVRAHWAAKPFCWQVYLQDDGAHLIKLEAFLQHFLAGASPLVAQVVHAIFAAWNTQDADAIATAWQVFYANLAEVQKHVEAQSKHLASQTDCAQNIMDMVVKN